MLSRITYARIIMKHAIVSVSGGLDSTSLLMRLIANGYKVHIVNFNYGSKQNDFEGGYLKRNLEYLKANGYDVDYRTIDISDAMGGLKSSLTREDIDTPEGEYNDSNRRVIFVPNRNAIFASIIYGMALSIYLDTKEDVDICMGIHAGEHDAEYPDCTPEFFEHLMDAFARGNYESTHIGSFVPYAGKCKTCVLADGISACKTLRLDPDVVYSNTLSCYSPTSEGLACGKCPTCLERLASFEKLGLTDPAKYSE